MRLLRYGPAGFERPAVLDSATGEVFDISAVTPDIDGRFLSGGGLAQLKDALTKGTLARIDITHQRIGAPIARPGSIYAIGLNYRDHAAESNLPVPTEPVVFMKPSNTLTGPHDPIRKPPNATKLDWEVELGIVIGSDALYLADERAAEAAIAGYVAVNDVSERLWQVSGGGQWTKGKAFPTSNPAGPWLVTPDEIDVGNLELTLRVNGISYQAGNTSNMIFSPAHLVWHVSQFIALEPGDLINTGTPAGVGMASDTYLGAGDVVDLVITGLGAHRSKVEGATQHLS